MHPGAGAGESQTPPLLVVNTAMLSCTMRLGPPVPLKAVPRGPQVTAGVLPDGDHRRHDPDGEHPNVRDVQLADDPGCDRGDTGRPWRAHANALNTGPQRPRDTGFRESGPGAGCRC